MLVFTVSVTRQTYLGQYLVFTVSVTRQTYLGQYLVFTVSVTRQTYLGHYLVFTVSVTRQTYLGQYLVFTVSVTRQTYLGQYLVFPADPLLFVRAEPVAISCCFLLFFLLLFRCFSFVHRGKCDSVAPSLPLAFQPFLCFTILLHIPYLSYNTPHKYQGTFPAGYGKH